MEVETRAKVSAGSNCSDSLLRYPGDPRSGAMPQAEESRKTACEVREKCPYCGSDMIQRRKNVCSGCGYCESCCDGGKQPLRGEGQSSRAD